jgi:hypothetical protein
MSMSEPARDVLPDRPAVPYEVIHLGGEAAAVVPVDEYRLLKALKDRASAEEIEDAWMDAAIAEHEAWEAAGRPGGTIPHEEVRTELLGGGAC